MRYERDEQGLRDARENLKDAEDEIAIAAIQKQIDLIEDEIKALEKQKKALEDQQEELQKAMEATSKYYEKLIEEQEKLFDDMIDKLNETKSKWEELAEVEEISKAWGLVEDAMKDLGFTVEDVLNDTPGAFEAFKNEYINVLNEMHKGDEGFLNGVKQFTDQVPQEFGKVTQAASEAKQPIEDVGTSAGNAAGKVSSFGTSAGTAATSVGQLKENSDGIADELNKINDVTFSEVNTALEGVETIIDRIIGKISGAAAEGGTSLKAALESLNDPMLIDNLRVAFTNLNAAINEVSAALGGGGADEEETYGGAGKHGKNGMPSDVPASAVSGGSGEGLVGAINAVKEATDTAIGTGKESEGGTAIGDFHMLGTKIEEVARDKIGIGDEEGETDNPETLIGSLGTLKIAVDTKMPEIIDWFTQLETKIQDCINKVLDLIKEIKNVEMPGEGGKYTGTANNFTGTAHYQGTAKVAGDWRVGKSEKSLVGELGPELVVDSAKGKYRVVGTHGPEFTQLHPSDIVFNHLQTKEILSKKNKIGPAHANGTLPAGFVRLSEDSTFETLKAKIKEIGLPTIDGIKTALQAQTDAIRSEVRNAVTNSSANATVTQNNTFNIQGVSGEDVARQINTTLVNTFNGMALNAYQRSMT